MLEIGQYSARAGADIQYSPKNSRAVATND